MVQAMGAVAHPMVSSTDADIVVGVKRMPDQLLHALRGKPLVWDVVDSHPQPAGNEWDERKCLRWLEQEIERVRPIAVIAATKRMAKDLEAFGLPVLWLPHHHRPGIERNPIRERIEVVGYEGSPGYVERWRKVIERECERIGARFVVNPERLADVDVVLALRDSSGYAPRHWKSSVKLANAHGSGTPFIGCRESGYLEMATGAEYWADTSAELRMSLDWLADQSTREMVADRFVQAAFPVEAAAAKLKEFLCALKSC